MSQPDESTALAANEFEITDAEREALAQAQDAAPAAGGAAAAPPAAAAPAESGAAAGQEGTPSGGAANAPAAAGDAEAAGAAAVNAGTGDGAAAAAAEVAAAAAAPAAPAVPAAPAAASFAAPAHFVPTYAADSERDFATEISGINQQLADLKAQYKGGQVDDEAYETQYEALRDQRAAVERAQDRAQLQADLSQQNADQAWAYLQRQFLSDPANAAIANNPLLFAAWEQGMQVVANLAAQEGRQLTDWDLLVGAREQLVAAGMLGTPGPAAAPPQPAAPPPPKPDRTPPLAQVPVTLSAVPAAADPTSRAAADAAAEQGIEDLEALLAGKSESERDRLLRDVPGAFTD
ncbi:hypothetical protein [Stenotrophomonas acidaminiphila]|uniref:hypothetical protein n=1 Tax=Stenotrophomonas acidaminiphila TaxID=128780 RepID=UPI0028AC4CBB|nr:hypothetical protein [Stenotrophomonas acidaminiphila]